MLRAVTETMSARFKPRAIVFDLDGTLVDTAGDIVAALDALLAERGRAPVGLEAGRRMIGDGGRVLVERGFAATGGVPADLDGALARWFEIYSADIARRSTVYPGVRATLAALGGRGIALGVCTNKADVPTASLLAALDLAAPFKAVVGGDFPHRKPDGRHVAAALAALGVPAGEALMVGDSPNDAKSARAAGLPFVAVDWGYTPVPANELGADAVISDFADLTALVA
jgi:phosphoglycolate phosphatase